MPAIRNNYVFFPLFLDVRGWTQVDEKGLMLNLVLVLWVVSQLFLLVVNLFWEVFVMTEHWMGAFHRGVDGFNYTAGFCKSSQERVPTKVNRSCTAASQRDQTYPQSLHNSSAPSLRGTAELRALVRTVMQMLCNWNSCYSFKYHPILKALQTKYISILLILLLFTLIYYITPIFIITYHRH